MRIEMNWLCPMLWETTEPLPKGVEDDHLAIIESPFGALTIVWQGGLWVWDEKPPKCPYGVNPCPTLETQYVRIMGPKILEWLEAHRPKE